MHVQNGEKNKVKWKTMIYINIENCKSGRFVCAIWDKKMYHIIFSHKFYQCLNTFHLQFVCRMRSRSRFNYKIPSHLAIKKESRSQLQNLLPVFKNYYDFDWIQRYNIGIIRNAIHRLLVTYKSWKCYFTKLEMEKCIFKG